MAGANNAILVLFMVSPGRVGSDVINRAVAYAMGRARRQRNDQCAFDNLLVVRLHAERIEAVIHHPTDNQHAEEGADQRPTPPAMLVPPITTARWRPAHTSAGVGLRRTGARGEDQAGDAGWRSAGVTVGIDNASNA